MKLTKVRKIEGDIDVLRNDLQVALGVEDKEVVINRLTGHIIVKVRLFFIHYILLHCLNCKNLRRWRRIEDYFAKPVRNGG